jgi:retron-type reverse transcriptase
VGATPDKVWRRDVLPFAYGCCFANQGAAGVDGQSFDDIEAYGWERWVDERAEELRKQTYRPQAVRRVYLPKPDGKQRPLGIPTIKDRVVQTAVLVVLEPIFEADLQPEQHAYRPAKCPGCCGEGPGPFTIGAYGGGGRGPERVFR